MGDLGEAVGDWEGPIFALRATDDANLSEFCCIGNDLGFATGCLGNIIVALGLVVTVDCLGDDRGED